MDLIPFHFHTFESPLSPHEIKDRVRNIGGPSEVPKMPSPDEENNQPDYSRKWFKSITPEGFSLMKTSEHRGSGMDRLNMITKLKETPGGTQVKAIIALGSGHIVLWGFGLFITLLIGCLVLFSYPWKPGFSIGMVICLIPAAIVHWVALAYFAKRYKPTLTTLKKILNIKP